MSPFRFVLTTLCFLLFGFSAVPAQFRTLYTPDSTDFQNVGRFDASQVIETGIPGREIAIIGSTNGFDSLGTSIQAAYLLQANSIGQPEMVSYYYDTTFFLQYPTVGYGVAYDGQGSFYMALGSNDECLALKTDTLGEVSWIIDGGHHDYFGVVYDNGIAAFLGQNESLLGDHDLSMARLDSAGNSPGADMMYGTTGFEIPQSCARVSDGYLLVGESNNNNFGCMVIKADHDLDMIWSRTFKLPNKNVFGQDVTVLPNDEGYCFTGRVRSNGGGQDSIFVMEVDTAGNAVWMNLYGLDSASLMYATSIDRVPGTGDLIIGGGYRGNRFGKSMAMAVDQDGNFLWARDYGDPDTTVEETINDVTVTQNGDYFYAVGDYTQITNQFYKAVLCIKASTSNGRIPCDTTLIFGQNSATPFDGDIAFTTPFLDNSPYPLIPITGSNVVADAICFIQVANADPLPEKEVLRVVNPAAQDIVVFHDLGLQSGWLELRNMQGQLLQKTLHIEGSNRIAIPAQGLSNGIYFLTLRNESEVFATRKVLVQP